MSVLDKLHLFEDTEPHSAAFNMAIDEALLEASAVPSLRTYRWQRPALSFGYFGSFTDVADQRNERDIVRRWTGGGIVLHGDDLTYSIIFPANHSFFGHSSLEIYTAVHDAIRRALSVNGVRAILAHSPSPRVSEDCFANAVRADLLCDGRKIAGAAHRRSRRGLLHQGSIQLGDLPRRLIDDFARLLCDRFERKSFSSELTEHAALIAQTKYGTDEWLIRR